MSYYNRYKNKRRQNGGGGPGGNNNNGNKGPDGSDPNTLGLLGNQQADAVFDLGKNKRVTVRQFRNINLIDIREYYMDNSTGEMRPGKKGISLTEDLYDELLKHRLNIDDALRRFGSRRPRTKTVRLLSDDEDDDDDADDGDKENKKNEKKSSKDSDKNKAGGDSNDKKATATATGDNGKPTKKRTREKDMKEGEEIEVKSRKQKVAPPTLLLHEETIANAKREANATLVIPSLPKAPEVKAPEAKAPEPKPEQTAAATVPEVKADEPAPQLTESPAVAPVPETQDNRDNNSSDGESLEAEMNKIFDEVSEEE